MSKSQVFNISKLVLKNTAKTVKFNAVKQVIQPKTIVPTMMFSGYLLNSFYQTYTRDFSILNATGGS